jgi:hypothetical protein
VGQLSILPDSGPFSGGFALVGAELDSLLSFLAQPVDPRLFSEIRDRARSIFLAFLRLYLLYIILPVDIKCILNNLVRCLNSPDADSNVNKIDLTLILLIQMD